MFLAGPALSGVAGSLGQLIAFRALQGTGAGGRAARARARGPRRRRTVAAALTCVLLVTTWGGRKDARGSAKIAGLAAAAVLLGAAFVVRERSAPEPLLPLRLFREPVFVVVTAALYLTMLAFFAVMVFMLLGLSRIGTGTTTATAALLLALIGAIFASRLGTASEDVERLQAAGAAEVASALHTVFLIGAPARVMIVSTPAGFERYFARMAAEWAGVDPPDWAMQGWPEIKRVGPQIGG